MSVLSNVILHLLFEDKFGEYAIRQFSGEEMCSEFVLITNSSASGCHHQFEGVKAITEDSEGFHHLLNRLGDYKAIILHGLFYPWQERVLMAVPANVKVAWVFWGGDIYGRADFKDKYLSKSSKRLLLAQNIKRLIKGRHIPRGYEIPFELLKRIDYCLTDIQEDFALVKEYLKTDIKELWYNYYSVEETIGELSHTKCDGANILIGNSCSLECNHVDGFNAVKKIRIPPGSNIYVPLSYGESWLKNAVTKRGRKQFGDVFIPLTTFLPRMQYNTIIKSCSMVIMPHYRPQAFGNILTALWLGARVFLSERNMLYNFFKRIGITLYSIESDLNSGNQALWSPLPDDAVEDNRKIITSIYSRDIMHQKNLELTNILNR